MVEQKSKLIPKQELQSKNFVNIKLNELIDSQRTIFDKNSMQLFFLGESFNLITIKREIHKKGNITEADFDNLLSTFINSTTMGELLEPMLKELYSEFAKEDIKKLHSDQKNEIINKESEDN